MNGRRGEANEAVHKAAGPGQPVTQEIAVSVKGDRIECAINGTVVAGYDKSALVTAGKLAATDGVYGLRFAHNTDIVVTPSRPPIPICFEDAVQHHESDCRGNRNTSPVLRAR